ncbi:MAG: M43 family zinc metalloprotease [Spirosomataceae bacterium]
MKKIFCIFILGIFTAFIQPIKAQICATPTPDKAVYIAPSKWSEIQAASDYLYVLRIFVHILRNNDGTNAATTPEQLKNDLLLMGSFFKPHNICFAFVGYDYMDNTTLNTAMNFSSTTHQNTILGFNRHTDAIDIYVHKGATASGGYAYGIPTTAFSVVQSANFNFYHEMGHALGLYHTFETFQGAECPDGSNCNTAGDLICDTAADFAGSQNSSIGCTYTGNMSTNCNGATRTYNPPTTNIMSYWASCYAQFTAHQGTRMRYFISLATNAGGLFQNHLISDNSSLSGFFGNPTNYTGEMRVAVKNEINVGSLNYPFNGNANFTGNHNSVVNAGNKITLKPGTRVSPSSGKITFKLNDICQ